MDRASRDERTAQRMQEYRALPTRQRGLVALALLANALIGGITYLALAIALGWSARQTWRQRRRGVLAAVRAALNPALICAIAVHVGWRVALVWANRMVDSGRGRVWLERLERWVTESGNQGGQSAED
jgi:hypothetical protein